MIQTAENVAAEAGITREQQDEMTVIRYAQYQDALANDAAFLKRFMILPFEAKDAEPRKRGNRMGLDTPVVHALNDAD